MTCAVCGATIAEKAIVCYRCGAPTASPVSAPRTRGAGRLRGAGVLLVGGIQLLLAFTISQVRRLLVDSERRQEQMVLSQQASNRRLEQLEDCAGEACLVGP